MEYANDAQELMAYAGELRQMVERMHEIANVYDDDSLHDKAEIISEHARGYEELANHWANGNN